VSITGGFRHFLALHANGSLTTWFVPWAVDYYGITNIPAGLTNPLAISAPASGAGEHNLALRHDGSLVAWGCDCAGSTSVPVDLTNVVAISAGGNGDGFDWNLALVADAPFFTAPQLQVATSNGVATVALQGEPHRLYVLESTPVLGNPVAWAFEKNVRLTSTNQIVHQSTVSQTRFYRARQLY